MLDHENLLAKVNVHGAESPSLQSVFDPEISLELEIDPDLLKIQFEPGLLDLPDWGGGDNGRG